MIAKLKQLILPAFVALIALAFSAGIVATVPSGDTAAKSIIETIFDGMNSMRSDDNQNNDDLPSTTLTIINIFLFIIGILSTCYLIYGGIKYVISAGDSTKVSSAKQTIQYAITGLIISILAYAIISFVVNTFAK